MRPISSNPSFSELFTRATQAHRASQFEQAEKLYRQVLAQVPEHAEAHHLLGLACSQQGRHAEAVEHIQRAIAIEGSKPTYHNNLGEVWRRDGQLEQAASSYRQALAVDPDFAQANFNLANVLKTQGHLSEAVHHYRQTLKLAPDHAKAHNNLGNALLEGGQLEAAIECYRQALQLNPDFSDARRNLYEALQQQDRQDKRAASLSPQAPKAARRIAFFVPYPFQHAMLDPIYHELKDEFPCLMSTDTQEIVAYQPQILVLAEHQGDFFRRYLPETIVIWTRHGFASKHYTKKSLEWCDFACVSSQWVRDDCIRRSWFPRLSFWVTGFSALDRTLSADSSPKKPPDIEGLDSAPTLLYTPTWNPELSAIEVLGPGWIEALRRQFPQLNIIIKLHPHTPKKYPHWAETYREMAQRDSRSYLVEEPGANSYDYMPFADILLTDVSSVMFYYLAFNRPIILVNNPRRIENEEWFDESGPEWTWRDMGLEIETVQELPAAIEASLHQPGEKAERRAFYRRRVFGDLLDGRASARIANRIRTLAQPEAADEEWVRVAWNSIRALGRFQRLLNRLWDDDDRQSYPAH
jgi:tetratricopeptide (TPR) repeat protein